MEARRPRKKTGPKLKYNAGHKTDILLGRREIAARFKVSEVTVSIWWRNGYLASHKIEGKVKKYSTEADLVEWGKIYYGVGEQPSVDITKPPVHPTGCSCFDCTVAAVRKSIDNNEGN